MSGVFTSYEMTGDGKRRKSSVRMWQIISLFLGLLSLALLIALIVVLTRDKPDRDNKEGVVPDKNNDGHVAPDTGSQVTDGDNPGIFDDLSKQELITLQNYLYSDNAKDLNLVRPSSVGWDKSFVYTSDLMPPNKDEVINYLDRNGTKPARRARILVFRGDKTPPVVEEFVVGPFPNLTEHKLLTLSTRVDRIPFNYRPIGFTEFITIWLALLGPLQGEIGDFLTEAFDARFTGCGQKCLTVSPHPMSPAITGKDGRTMFLSVYHKVPYYALHPVDFVVQVNMDGKNIFAFKIEKLIYKNKTFASGQELKAAYDAGQIEIQKIPFPTVDVNLFSSLDYRGGENKNSKRPPQLVEPDGKRYTLNNRHVKYMDWQFDFRMSTLSGPQLFNIMYGKDRIAYEVGLQEIVVFYSGINPALRMSDFVDSAALLGVHTKSLVPGGDCPETATYIPFSYLQEIQDVTHTNERAFCLFEQNTGTPLRRHLSYATDEGGFYGGLLDSVLILRTIITVANYDYIFDFIFHQNGAMEVKALSTGYVLTSFFSEQANNKYGFRLHDNILGNIHHHMFHFKADLDILGRSNRYETLNIETEDVDNSMWTGNQGDTYNQIYFTKTTKTSEKEAAYKFNFDTPRYHIFHNEAEKTKHGVSRAYRVQMNGMSKQTLRENGGNEGTIPWARYQMAVTKFKQDEFCSSSPYKMFDGRKPVVNFQKYIDDNDNIMDEDLVLWLTMGVHHIPHTEDLPITPTPGAHLSFALLPYNYFDEDPSMKSPDTVTVNHKNPSKPEEGVIVRRYHNTTSDKACVPLPTDDMSVYEKNPDVVLQSKNQLGIV